MFNNHPQTIEKLKRDVKLAALFAHPAEHTPAATPSAHNPAIISVAEQFQEILKVAGADLIEQRVE